MFILKWPEILLIDIVLTSFHWHRENLVQSTNMQSHFNNAQERYKGFTARSGDLSGCYYTLIFLYLIGWHIMKHYLSRNKLYAKYPLYTRKHKIIAQLLHILNYIFLIHCRASCKKMYRHSLKICRTWMYLHAGRRSEKLWRPLRWEPKSSLYKKVVFVHK